MINESSELQLAGSVSPEELQASVEKQVTHAVNCSERTLANLTPIPVSLTFRCDEIPVLSWLHRVSTSPRVYWRGRDGGMEIAGVGTAATVMTNDPSEISSAFNKIEAILSASSENHFLKFFGGSRFDPQGDVDGLWKQFPCLWFVLPRLIITRDGEDFYLTVTTCWNGKDEIKDLQTRLLESYDLFIQVLARRNRDELPPVLSRLDTPTRGRWSANVGRVLSEVAAGRVEKAVLARRTDLKTSAPLDPCSYLESVTVDNQNCFSFMFEPTRGTAFVGASPERLFRMSGRRISSEAVAGTIAAGGNDLEARVNAENLLSSEKDRQEQRCVADELRAKLEGLCESVSGHGSPGVMRLVNVQHLVTRFDGTLRRATRLDDIYRTIHPTAAVCGAPQEAARKLLREIEGFDRGWYASGVGVIGHQAAEMAVAIRSALVTDEMVSLFAGAGIVKGSDPESEWQELEHKISVGLAAFARGASESRSR